MEPRERWALAALALSGAVFVPLALNRFVFAKLALAAAAIVLAFAVRPRGRLPRAAVALLLASAIVLMLAALTGQTPLAQFLGRPPRYEGVFVLPVYLGALLAGTRLLGPGRARGSMAWFLRWLAVAAVAIGVEALAEAAGLRPLASDVARPGSLLGNASDEGAWALLALGPLANVALRVRGRLYAVGAIGAASALVCSGSRGALLGAGALAAVLAVLAPRPRLRVLIVGALAGVALCAVALSASRSHVLGRSALARRTVTGRRLLWQETAQLLSARPVLGVGPSGYVDAIPRYNTRSYELAVGPANPPDSPHDWILQSAAAGGLLLALLAVALAALTLLQGARALGTQRTRGEAVAVAGMLAGLSGYAVALLFHFTSPGTTPLAAVFAGALLAVRPRGDSAISAAHRQAGPARRLGWVSRAPVAWWPCRVARAVRSTAFGALVLVLGAAALAEIPLRSALVAAASGHFVAANEDFRIAEALRPWDLAITAIAGHAYATLAGAGSSSAARFGVGWSERDVAAFPHSVQALADAATLAAAGGEHARAAALLARALRVDPNNPDLRARAQALARAGQRASNGGNVALHAQRHAPIRHERSTLRYSGDP
jgi:O-antigen ligase